MIDKYLGKIMYKDLNWSRGSTKIWIGHVVRKMRSEYSAQYAKILNPRANFDAMNFRRFFSYTREYDRAPIPHHAYNLIIRFVAYILYIICDKRDDGENESEPDECPGGADCTEVG